MKTLLLLATSALVASATLAHAQAVTIDGEGRMGIQFTNPGVWSWTLEHRLTLNLNVAIESDHGLSFGAWTRARMSSTMAGTLAPSRVWVEANGLRLTIGNADGAIATAGTSHGWLGGCMVGYEYGQICGDAVGLDLFAHQERDVPSAHQARITYTTGDTVIAVSSQDGVSTEFGARTTFGAFTAAAGYSDLGTGIWTVSGHYDAGAWGAGLIVADVLGTTNWALSGTANLGGGVLYGYYGDVFGSAAYGLSYGYDLGGGATATIGAERADYLALTTASVGIAFNF